MQRPAYFSWRRTATPIALAFVSLIAAISLWIAVTDAQNPNRVTVFGGGIEVKAVNVPEGLAVASIRNPTVSLKISAAEDTFRKLTTADFSAEVDLSGVRQTTSDQVVIANVESSNRDVQIIEVAPAFVTVTLEPLASKQVPVKPNPIGSPPQGFSVTAIDPNPATVTVTGATSLVQLVDSATADVNLTGLRASLQQQYSLVPRDTRGVDIRGLKLDPASADIHLNVAQQEVTLALTIVPQVTGRVADGYDLVGIAADPPAVPVSGALEALQALPYLSTDPIDISGLRADLTRSAKLRIPSGVQASRDSVSVHLHVVPSQGEITLTIAPQVTGLAEGLKATLQTSSVTVRLAGEVPTLRALAPGSVRATVSASGLTEGIQVLNPTVTAPEGVQVVASDPSQVVVVLHR